MSSLKTKLLAIGLLIVFGSCNENEQSNRAHLYPLDSLIKAQAGMLAHAKARLAKTAEIDGEKEETSCVPGDTTAWLHELDIFTALNSVNGPTSINEYDVKDGIPDKSSNLTIKSFTTTKDLPVVYIKIFYYDKLEKLRRIEALYHEENSLLKGSRHLTMEFHDIYDRPTLTSYIVEGGQEMFLSKNIKFSVKGVITIP